MGVNLSTVKSQGLFIGQYFPYTIKTGGRKHDMKILSNNLSFSSNNTINNKEKTESNVCVVIYFLSNRLFSYDCFVIKECCRFLLDIGHLGFSLQ